MRTIINTVWLALRAEELTRRRRLLVSAILGSVITVAICAVQAWTATSRRDLGLLAYGGAVQLGTWTPQSGEPSWNWAAADAWCGSWFGAVRQDGYAVSRMWDVRDLGLVRLRGGSSAPDRLPTESGWLGDASVASMPWVAGIESLAVGWPVRCLRGTYVWNSLAEHDLLYRRETVEGHDVSASDAEWAAGLLGITEIQPPRSVVPTRVLWLGLGINLSIWTMTVLATISFPRMVRAARCVWWERQGRCSSCGYGLAAAPHGDACPECGVRLGAVRDPRPVG
jgi:hypothetical protein